MPLDHTQALEKRKQRPLWYKAGVGRLPPGSKVISIIVPWFLHDFCFFVQISAAPHCCIFSLLQSHGGEPKRMKPFHRNTRTLDRPQLCETERFQHPWRNDSEDAQGNDGAHDGVFDDEALDALCCCPGFVVRVVDGRPQLVVRGLECGGELLEDPFGNVGAPAGGADERVEIHVEGFAGEARGEQGGDDVFCNFRGRSWVGVVRGEQRCFLVGVGVVFWLRSAWEAGEDCVQTCHCHDARCSGGR